MKKKLFWVLLIFISLIGVRQYLKHRQAELVEPAPAQEPTPIQEPAPNNLEAIKEDMLQQLAQNENVSRRLLIPDQPPEAPLLESPPPPPVQVDERAKGRKKREGLPMGIVLWDDSPIFGSQKMDKVIYKVRTGDVVRVFPDGTDALIHIQPGLDIYLAATTKEVRPAGEHLPDIDGWIQAKHLHVFEPNDAKEFLSDVAPVTLGNDTNFSTFDFYDRAMKNSDPVVHRIVGPRMIALVLLHEDYSASWAALYRDRDPKIRDAALSALSERGVANNRQLIEDLIKRLAELTKGQARGETELEALSILGVLKKSGHARVPAALASFKEDWNKTQGAKLNDALSDVLQNQ